jgi:ligand-binding SRPBCC domain-containing protein
MPTIQTSIFIVAPIERVFNLARDVDVHCQTAAFSRERAVGGKTLGMLELGDAITFEGVHFGIRQRLTARIIEFDPPKRFVDEMVSGAFRSLRHVHQFEEVNGGTHMQDTITWESPLGVLGRVADLFVGPHLRRFLKRRNDELKRIAEYLDGDCPRA